MTYDTDRHPPPTASGPVIEDRDAPADPERDLDSSTADPDADVIDAEVVDDDDRDLGAADVRTDADALADQSRVAYPEDAGTAADDAPADADLPADRLDGDVPADDRLDGDVPADDRLDEEAAADRVDVTDPDDLPEPEDLTDTAASDDAAVADDAVVADDVAVADADAATDHDVVTADDSVAGDTTDLAPGADRADVYAVAATDTATEADTADVDTADAAAAEPVTEPVAAAESMPGGVPDEPLGALWPEQVGDGFRDRWRDLQLRFVDDPAAAAADAEELVAEAVDRFSATLAERKRDLDGWRGGDGTGDTEQMRVVLRRYRDFLDRLLRL